MAYRSGLVCAKNSKAVSAVETIEMNGSGIGGGQICGLRGLGKPGSRGCNIGYGHVLIPPVDMGKGPITPTMQRGSVSIWTIRQAWLHALLLVSGKSRMHLFLFVAQEEQPLPESGAPFCALASKKFAICRNLPALCLVPFSKMKAHLMPDLSPMRRIRYALVRKTKFPVEGNKRLLAGEDNASPLACARFGNHF